MGNCIFSTLPYLGVIWLYQTEKVLFILFPGSNSEPFGVGGCSINIRVEIQNVNGTQFM